jgi:chromosome partitioning protein
MASDGDCGGSFQQGRSGEATLAVELAYALGAILVDLDHDDGGATASWNAVGTLGPDYSRWSLLEGDGPGPRILTREGLPALIPAHPDYGAAVQ